MAREQIQLPNGSTKKAEVRDHAVLEGHVAWADMIIPTITPNNPSALPKISITRILTKRVEFCASDNAQLLPIIPTQSLFIGIYLGRWSSETEENAVCKQVPLIRKSYKPANKVGKAHNYSRGKYCISCSKGLCCIYLWCWDTL